MGRRWIATCVGGLALVLAVTGGTAIGKSRGGVDRTFGSSGTVALSYLVNKEAFPWFSSMTTGPGRTIYLLNSETSCPNPGTCTYAFRLTRLLADGSLDRTYGDGGSTRVPLGSYYAKGRLAIDGAGRAVLAVGSPGSIAVSRFTPEGQVDASFGSGGTVIVPCDCVPMTPEVGFAGEGRITLAAGYGHNLYGESEEGRAMVARLTPSGALDPRFGSGGLVDLALHTRGPVNPAAQVRANGSVVLGGVSESMYLIQIGPDGNVDHRFGSRFRESLRALRLLAGPEEIGDLVPGPHGSVGAVGGNGNFAEGFAMRVLRSGRLDRSFAKNGYRTLPIRATHAVSAGRGKMVVAGEEGEGLEVLVFDRSGHRDRSFGGGRRLILASWNDLASLAMQGHRPLLFDDGSLECRGYCPPGPQLLRMKAVP